VILLAGLTPAWQQTLVFDAFTPGQVNRAREVYWNASGKVLNAAAAVRWLGGDGLAVAPVGGPATAAFDRELDSLGIRRRWIATEASTRVCTTILDRSRGTMTELVENGRPLAPAELDAYLAAYAEEAARAEVAVVSGSLPLCTPDGYYRELVRRTPCPMVLDFRGPGLLGVMDLKPLVVKPNRQELAETLGRPLGTDDELLAAMREVNRRGAQWVIVTQGSGPVWLSSAESIHRFQPPTVSDIVNPLGSGDAMAATVAWAVHEGRDIPEAVPVAIAAAADNLRHVLPCRFDRDAVFGLAEQVREDRVACP
jgi:tagatose 6-phosphate kinase